MFAYCGSQFLFLCMTDVRKADLFFSAFLCCDFLARYACMSRDPLQNNLRWLGQLIDISLFCESSGVSEVKDCNAERESKKRLLFGVFVLTVSEPLYHYRVPGVPLCSWSTDFHLVLTVKQKAILVSWWKRHILHFVWHFLLIHQCRCGSRLLQGSVCLSPPWSESSALVFFHSYARDVGPDLSKQAFWGPGA